MENHFTKAVSPQQQRLLASKLSRSCQKGLLLLLAVVSVLTFVLLVGSMGKRNTMKAVPILGAIKNRIGI